VKSGRPAPTAPLLGSGRDDVSSQPQDRYHADRPRFGSITADGIIIGSRRATACMGVGPGESHHRLNDPTVTFLLMATQAMHLQQTGMPLLVFDRLFLEERPDDRAGLAPAGELEEALAAHMAPGSSQRG
jgi:hypothetical protein